MAGFLIICAGPYRMAGGHRHVVNFGIGKQSDSLGTKWTSDAIHDALHAGRRFYIVDGEGIEVDAVPYSCVCGVKTIRLSRSVCSDNPTEDLSSVLPSCTWCDSACEVSPIEPCRAAHPTPLHARR